MQLFSKELTGTVDVYSKQEHLCLATARSLGFLLQTWIYITKCVCLDLHGKSLAEYIQHCK